MTVPPEVVRPETVEDVRDAIRGLRSRGVAAVIRGSGSTATPGAEVVLSMDGMTGVIDHQPDDLTVVVKAGTSLRELDASLAVHRQTAVLPETDPARTIGGVVASGASGYRRLRYGPTRDRVLGVTLVTGYGEVVAGGGRLVKNVTGYDLPRLVTGSLGSLGVVTDVCLKLWPIPRCARTIPVADPEAALARLHRPLAVLETPAGSWVFIEGSESVVDATVEAIGAHGADGLSWPERISSPVQLSVRVPATSVVRAVDTIRAEGPAAYVAQHGVGVIDVGFDRLDVGALDGLRTRVSAIGGVIVVDRWPGGRLPDRWGDTEPGALGIQRRLKGLFDPDGVLNLGVLPGGI